MVKTSVAVFAVCALLVTWRAAQAQSTPPAISTPTPQEIIAARQASMSMSGAVRGYMKIAILGGGEAKRAVYPADGLALWAKALPGMFPGGTGPDAAKTYAKAEIWSDHAGFEKAANDFIAATDKLSRLAHASDTENFKEQLEVVDQRCTACHDTFRSEFP